jgi:hypothetical protein
MIVNEVRIARHPHLPPIVWLVPRHGWCMADPVALHSGSDDLLRVAIAAHLARYKGLSRAHTSSDLQVFLRCCTDHQLEPLAVRRADVEMFVRWLEEIRRFKPSTVSQRLSVVTCFYRTCVIDAVWMPPRPPTFTARRSRASHRRWAYAICSSKR